MNKNDKDILDVNCQVTNALLGIDVTAKHPAPNKWDLVGGRQRVLRLGPVELNCYIMHNTNDNHYVVWAERRTFSEHLAIAACQAVATHSSETVTIFLAEESQELREVNLSLPRGEVWELLQDGESKALVVTKDLYDSFPSMWHHYASNVYSVNVVIVMH